MIEKIDTSEYLQISRNTFLFSGKKKSLIYCGVIGWTYICVKTTYLMLLSNHQVPLHESIFVSFFIWVGELIALSLLMWQHYRKEILRVDSEGITHKQVLFFPLTSFYFTWKELFVKKGDFRFVKFYCVKTDSYTEEFGIEFHAKQISFRCFISHDRKYNHDYSCEQIEKKEISSLIEVLNAKISFFDLKKSANFSVISSKRNNGGFGEKLLCGRWSLNEDINGLTYERNGWIPPHTIMIHLLGCVFIIGAVFIMFPFGATPSIESLILFPFLFMGILGFWGVLSMFLQYFVCYTFKIEHEGVRYRCSFCGIRKDKFWKYCEFTTVNVSRLQKKITTFSYLIDPELILSQDGKTHPFPYAVQLFDQTMKPIATIKGFRGHEAEQISKAIQKEMKIYYKRQV